MYGKKILLLMLALVLITVLIACTTEKTTTTTTQSESTHAPTATTQANATQAAVTTSQGSTQVQVTTQAVATQAVTPVTHAPGEYPEYDESYTIYMDINVIGFENHHDMHVDPDTGEHRYVYVFTYGDAALADDIYANEGVYTWIVTITDGENEWVFEDVQNFSYYPDDGSTPNYFRVELGDFVPVKTMPIPTYTIEIAIYNMEEFTMDYYHEYTMEGYNAPSVSFDSYYPILSSSISDITGAGLEPWGDGAYENILDGNTTETKMGGSVSGEAVFVSFKADAEYNVVGYELVTGGDTQSYADRNPDGWKLYGSNDGTTWEIIDDRSSTALPAQNSLPIGFMLEEAVSYQYFKIDFIVTSGSFQMNELMLYYRN